VLSEWSSAITVKDYHWTASKSELRDLDTPERYHNRNLLGGINLPGGVNTISLTVEPPNPFNFFNGSRLDLSVVVEGDMDIGFPQYGSDFHLLLLPIKINDSNFFKALFDERQLLENLTHSRYLNSSVTGSTAIAFLKYNDILDIQYIWDTSTGILTRKEVTASSGYQLIVVRGRSSIIPAWTYPLVLIAVLIVVLQHIINRNDKSAII